MSAAGPHVSRSRAGSSTATHEKGRLAHMHGYAMATPNNTINASRYFDPCAATASMFLYAQGTSVVCCHYDTLAIERRFARHAEEVQLLAVDNHSDIGAGRLVVSYDVGQTAIVWDLLTGDEVARFASYENLTCASWMRNGNVAFGNSQGNVILFEPTTSEHLSARTIDQIAITAISPAADCRTFAIGYQNGSLLIATLQPRFTILHNLTTSRGPSPIVTLSWHASSSRSKSDMLSVQTNDGDLRVWSVSKAYNADDPAKIVRILKRTENYLTGPNWMGWSKNGRIIQHSESETISWDVRTKHVTYDTIPTLDTIRGLAVYGPSGTLFTLGANNTVQQFDLNAPAMMVQNVQHPANLLPPSPPISLEAEEKSQPGHVSESESQVEITFRPADMSDQEDGRSPLARYLQSESDTEQYRPTTPASNISRSTVSISSSTSQTAARRYPASTVSRGMTENTYISAGSSLRSGYTQPRERKERESLSTTSSISMGSSHYHTARKPSRLRNEVPRSPEDARVVDLFKFTKSRLADVPYKAPFSSDNSRLTNDDLRRQMLSTIFGWHKDIDDLVRDEMSRHPLGSTNRILLAKWLGDINTDIMAMGSENMTSSDWMLLALSGIGGQASQHKLGRAYVQRLLESGDVHAAATIMVGMGDHNDAVEIYVSHKKYMEALVLTCLFFPAAWERQEQIVKKWGEWAVQHGQQQLAIRCFACTGRESTEPWSSPSAQQLTFPSITQTVPELLSPPLSPPVMNHGPQRSIAKNSALKLITSFDPHAKNRLLANVDDGKTPIAAAATPMLETALSPGGADPATAILRGNRSQFNTPASARPVHGFGRQRLPSIGEAPDSAQRDLLTAIARPEGDPYANAFQSTEVHDTAVRKLELTRPNTASPRLMKENVKGHPPPSPSPAAVAALMEGGRYRRNGSRSRIPEGLDLSLPSFKDSLPEDLTSPEPSANSSVRYHWPSRRRGPGSVASSVSVASAASSVARSQRGYHNSQSKGLDNYVHSLDAAPTKKQIRESSRDGRNERATSRSRKDNRGKSQDRGRASSRSYTPKGGKRSPKSPVPMSPEDLINLATPKEDFDQMSHNGGKGRLIDISNDEMELPSQPSTVKKVGYANRDGSRVRGSSRTASRNGRSSSRARSPDKRHVPPALDLRGRSVSRGPPSNRSPSSPQPMSANLQQHYYGSDDEEDYRQAVEAQEKFRQRNNRSASRARGEVPASPMSVRSTAWSTREAPREKSDLRRNTSHAGTETSSRRKIAAPLKTPAPMQLVADNNSGDLRVIKDERQLKKEAAARELEARRKSLATRPSAPPIMHPDEITPAPLASALPSLMELPSTTYVPPKKEDLPFRSASVDPSAGRSMYATRNRPAIGLPATPRAMRLVMDSESSSRNAPVPPIPSTFAQASPAMPPQAQPQPQPQRESPGRRSPERVEEERKVDDIPMLLSSSVYTPPPPAQSRIAAQIGRSMSAPPRDLVQPETQSRRPSVVNSTSMGRRPSHDANAFPARRPSHDANAFPSRRPSHDANANIPPPPPPPVPPMLKELQHLAQPPPPPPAPLPHVGGPQPVVYGGSSGMIEIVMDDDQPQPPQQLQQQLQQQLYPQQYQPQQQQHQQPPPPPPIPSAIPVSEATVPIISTPNPRNGHNRGRSSVDSIAGRISRATERMRSASRSRGPSSIKSPEMMGGAPYESVPPPPPPPAPSSHPPVSMGMNYRVQNQVVYQQVQAQVAQQEGRNEYRTGLHQSEMI